jgi:Ca2+-binding RTX toxin-like protein
MLPQHGPDDLAAALAQRHPFLDTPPLTALGLAQNDAGLMAWALLASLEPAHDQRLTLAQWLRDGTLPLDVPPQPEIEALLARGLTALGTMAHSGTLEARLAAALTVPEEATPLPMSGGGGAWIGEAALEPLELSSTLSGVVVPVALGPLAVFASGTPSGGETTFGRVHPGPVARDDLYRHLPGALEATFDANAESFSYTDDPFRGTAQPGYAQGNYLAAGAYDGGGLRVLLGSLDNVAVLGMSGGWERQITLAEASEVTVAFRYNLTHSGHHENDEYAEVMLSVNGVLYGSGANDYIQRITGDGDGGPDQTTGWQYFTVDVGTLAAGTHSVIIGGYANKKTFNDEFAEILIDEVTITDSGPLIVGRIDGVLANDWKVDGFNLNGELVSGPDYGSLTFNANGGFTYTPDSNFLGIDGFTYRAVDGVLGDLGQVVIEVGNVVEGTAAAEVLSGTSARDALLGYAGDDTLNGANGDDRLTGGKGADRLTGGDGADIFAYASGDGGGGIASADVITDFEDGTDLIGLMGSLSGLTIAGAGLTVTNNGGDAVITVVASGEVLTVVTGAFGSIDDTDFVAL